MKDNNKLKETFTNKNGESFEAREIKVETFTQEERKCRQCDISVYDCLLVQCNEKERRDKKNVVFVKIKEQ